MRMYEASEFVTATLIGDADIDAISIGNFGKTLHYYTHEDYHRLKELQFPYCHTLCHSKVTDTDMTSYVLIMEVSALRVDSEVTERSTTEKTTDSIGVVVEKILSTIREELLTFGINGVKGYSLANVSEMIVAPRGEDDIRYVLEFELHQKNC